EREVGAGVRGDPRRGARGLRGCGRRDRQRAHGFQLRRLGTRPPRLRTTRTGLDGRSDSAGPGLGHVRDRAPVVSAPRASGSLGDELTNFAIGGLVAAVLLAGILRAAGSVAAWITGVPQPVGGIESGLGVLLHPFDPAAALDAAGLNVFAYWAVAAIFLGAAAATAGWAWRLVRENSRASKFDPYRI